MKKRILVIALSVGMLFSTASVVSADIARPAADENRVQGTYDKTLKPGAGDVDFTIDGKHMLPEGAATYLQMKYDGNILVTAGATTALTTGTNVVKNGKSSVRTVYRISSDIPAADGGHYRFSKDMFLGLSMSDVAKSYNALSAEEKLKVGTSNADLIEYADITLTKSKVSLKMKADLPKGWSYEVSEDGLTATITYTFTDEDVAVGEARIAGEMNGVIRKLVYAPVLVFEKLDGEQVEASYFTITETNSYIERHNKMSEFAEYGHVNKRQYLTDKRGALISREIAPVKKDGTVGAYQDTSDTIWLEPGQKARIRVAVSRPYGVVKALNLEISEYIADNKKYTDGFTFVKDSVLVDTSNAKETVTTVPVTTAAEDWLVQKKENKTVENINNGILNINLDKISIGDTLSYTYDIKAPASVDDPGTAVKEHKRLFYSNTNMINEYQRTLQYESVDYIEGGTWNWKSPFIKEATDNTKDVGSSVYERAEWLLTTPQFVLGLKDNPNIEVNSDKNENNGPKTGDDIGMTIAIAILLMTGAAIGITILLIRRNKTK